MASSGTILVGTVGQGVFVSSDNGERWGRASVGNGMHSDCIVRAMVSDPRRPEVVFVGTDMGLYRTDDAGAGWQLLNTAMNGHTVWALAIDPVDPNIMYVGTGTPSEPCLYRSTDNGKSWERRPMEIAENCPDVGIPRFTGIAVDPVDHRNLWVGLEVEGARHSTNGAESWARVNGQITNPDIHNVLVIAGPPKKVIIVVNDEVWSSTDDGATWEAAEAQSTFPSLGSDNRGRRNYPRGIAAKPDDSKVLFLTLGDTTPGVTGTVMRSKDAGKTWENLSLPVPPNSAMWTVSIPAAEPNLVFAASRFGYLYRSEDGGDSWAKIGREFSEVSAIVRVAG